MNKSVCSLNSYCVVFLHEAIDTRKEKKMMKLPNHSCGTFNQKIESKLCMFMMMKYYEYI